MRVMVTGGAGFIGSRVVRKLREYGVTPRVFDLVPHPDPDVESYTGSIMDLEQIRSAMRGVDAVMHLAAIADVGDVLKEPHYSEMVNVRGTINVLESMRTSGISRLVYGSTTWVYEAAEPNTVDETTPLGNPTHIYTATKLAGEFYCRSYGSLYGLEPTVLRYGIPYGPGARPAGVIALFVRRALSGESLTIAGDGLQFRKFVYVDDLAEGNVLALNPKAVHQTYNLDGSRKVSILELAETVQKIVGDVDIEFMPAREGDFDGKEVISLRAKEELGWSPDVPLEEGIRKYVDWLKLQEDEVKGRWSKVSGRLTS